MMAYSPSHSTLESTVRCAYRSTLSFFLSSDDYGRVRGDF